MTSDAALQLVSHMFWVGLLIMAPLLFVVMVVGILVSIFQVVTQIQEMSLSFIPKIVTVVLVLQIFGPWMLKLLVNYSASVIAGIPGYF
ncbi:flagellar biosynthetic protein FliQ [Pseudomethylobacillus aquaticus]|uniref:Flagellar biosynthetic protein FliQ n=1 Tax=Pseudomethylobacillus aquaticus TaxID=2676064 RepID=A0A3N0UZG9_9PROT|nr:flagellar biosynthesis protein FliQ [Pseudomethylobacillus aquaticus]ROH85937.1 flagellar biosynthetic protein FliQ [Pseudomethylobacillus aquaticus]